LPEGKYENFAQWAAFDNRASNAKYTIFNNGIELRDFWADQRINGGQSNSLGVFYLERGTQDVVLSELVKMNGILIADAVMFENICKADPCVYVKTPQDYHLQTSGTIFTVATVETVNTISQYGVWFVLDEGTADEQEILDLSFPFDANFTVPVPSEMEHSIDVYLTDSTGAPLGGLNGHDSVVSVGIGEYYVAMGNSTTHGVGDDDISDDISEDQRNGGGGYPPVLNNLLTTQFSGVPHTVINEGVPGALSVDGAVIVNSLLQKHPLAQFFVVLYGINDSGAFPPVPSGLGLDSSHPNYPGTFKDNVQQIIDAVNLAGKKAILVKVSIVLGDEVDSTRYPDPDTAQRNITIKEYNQVIDELAAAHPNNITVTPADLYAKFNEIIDVGTGQRRYELEYADNFHMNGEGYRTIAQMLLDVILGD
jgi:lysophospholipase L1-like esterase